MTEHPDMKVRSFEMYCGDPDPTCPGLEVPGWMTEGEMRWLYAQAKKMRSIAEIGCLLGRSTTPLLAGCRGPVWAIDCWHMENAMGLTYFVQNCGHYKNLRVIHDFSHNAAKHVPSVEMTFIDGDHLYESIKQDIEDWMPKTTKLLCGHDFGHEGYPGVKKRVIEVFGDNFKVVEGESIWYVEL